MQIYSRTKLLKTLILAALTLIQAVIFSASGETMLFNHISEDNLSGLSCNNVTSICEDKDGFVWIGTSYGLNRFDGNVIKTYFSKETKALSNSTCCLESDNDGNVWVGTTDGLTVHLRESDSFFTPKLANGEDFSGRSIINISANRFDGSVWVATRDGGLYSTSSPTACLKFFDTQLGYQIRNICFTKTDGLLLLGNYGSLFFFDPPTGKTSVPDFVRNNDFFKINDITCICSAPGNQDLVYCISSQKGLFLLNLQNRSIKQLCKLPLKYAPCKLSATNENVYIATKYGLVKYDILLSEATYFYNDPSDLFSITGNNLSSVFCDSKSRVWTGSYYDGANYSIQGGNFFHTYHQSSEGLSLAGSVVINFCEDHKGTIWVATEAGKIFKFKPSSGELIYPGIFLDTPIRTICCEGDHLWITGEKCTFKYNTTTGKLSNYSNDTATGYDRTLFNGKDVFYTNKYSILKFDKTADKIETLFETGGYTTREAISDKNGVLWFATFTNGIFRFDPSRDKVWTHNDRDVLDISDKDVFTITASADSQAVVISKNLEFYFYDGNAGKFIKRNKQKTELEYDVISMRIVADLEDNIWVPYYNGLALIKPESSIASFYESGTILRKKLCSSSFRASDGTLYFGSRDGFICFNPSKIRSSSIIAKAVLTDFQINGTDADKGNINLIESIRLASTENSFSVKVCCPSGGNVNTILYQLEGVDKQYTVVPVSGTISYFNLRPGKYTLLLKSRNSSGEYDLCHTPTRFIIAAPFLLSIPGIVILLLSILLCLAIVVFFLKQHEQRKAKEEAIKEKIGFFSGVIHEIKTPLTLISSPLKNILDSKEKFSPEVTEDLNTISSASSYIMSLITELMSYIKSERTEYSINRTTIDLSKTIADSIQKFKGPSDAKNLVIQTYGIEESIFIEADEHAIRKILNNILQNAIKYASHLIVVRVERKEDTIDVLIHNDGPVIPHEFREKIFEPFFQYGTAAGDPSSNFGIGLAFSRKLSRLHGGDIVLNDKKDTEFILSLPVGEPLPERQAEKTSMEEHPVQQSNDSRYRLLIVEDNSSLATFTGRKLSSKYFTTTTSSAEEALKILKKGETDILITDIGLEGMSGLELCRCVSSDETISHIPIVVVSAMFEEHTKIDCMKAGASIFIDKPFTTDYLLACIDNIVVKMENLRSQVIHGDLISGGESNNIKERDADFLNRLESSMKAHLEDESFSVHTICEDLCMSQSTLTRKLSGILGMTPVEYIKERRLIIAAQMLSSGKELVGDVCYRVGFSSKSYFSKCFKERFGKSPSEYSLTTKY